jgi:hypothetical protein
LSDDEVVISHTGIRDTKIEKNAYNKPEDACVNVENVSRFVRRKLHFLRYKEKPALLVANLPLAPSQQKRSKIHGEGVPE